MILRPIHAVVWTRVRLAAYVAYAAVLVVDRHRLRRTHRAHDARDHHLSGLLLTSIGRGWRQSLQVLLDWLPFTARPARSTTAPAAWPTRSACTLHEADIVHVGEVAVFGGVDRRSGCSSTSTTPTHVYWYDALCTLIYTSHFLLTPVLAAVLWLRDRALWLRYITRVIVLSVAGLITYCAVPRGAAVDGRPRRPDSSRWRGCPRGAGSGCTRATSTARWRTRRTDGSNPVAAMPSLHTAFATPRGDVHRHASCARGGGGCWCCIPSRWASRSSTPASTGSLDLVVGRVLCARRALAGQLRGSARRAAKARPPAADLPDVAASAEAPDARSAVAARHCARAFERSRPCVERSNTVINCRNRAGSPVRVANVAYDSRVAPGAYGI